MKLARGSWLVIGIVGAAIVLAGLGKLIRPVKPPMIGPPSEPATTSQPIGE